MKNNTMLLVLLVSLVARAQAVNLNDIFNKVGDAFTEIGSIASKVTEIPNEVTSAINGVESFFTNDVKGAFDTAIGGVDTAINSIDTEVNEILGPLKSQVLEPAEAFADKALSKIDMVVDEATTSDP